MLESTQKQRKTTKNLRLGMSKRVFGIPQRAFGIAKLASIMPKQAFGITQRAFIMPGCRFGITKLRRFMMEDDFGMMDGVFSMARPGRPVVRAHIII